MNDAAAGLVQMALYTVRSGTDYMFMLAVMSFNGGVFLAAVGKRMVGFLVFGSRAFRNSDVLGLRSKGPSNLPPMKC